MNIHRAKLRLRFRETVMVILCWILGIIAAFNLGVIYGKGQEEDFREKYYTIDRRVMSIDGRLTAIEGPQKDQKTVGGREIGR